MKLKTKTQKLKTNIVVVLDNVRSALNVGAIFRTCDGAGVSKLYLTGITPYPPHPRVIKTAIGAEDYVKYEYAKDTIETVNKLKKEGYEIIAIEQSDKSMNLGEYTFRDKVAVIFGNEITGVNQQILNTVDVSLELPMYGKKNSLNVATTVGIVLYTIRLK